MEQINITQLSPESFRELLSEIIREQIHEFNSDPPDQLLTRAELSKRLKISLPTISQYTNDGILVSRKIGRRIYYKWSDVQKAAIVVEKYRKGR